MIDSVATKPGPESDPDGPDWPGTDFADLGNVIAVSHRVVDALGEVLLRCGVLLPLSHPREAWFGYQVTNTLDVVDLERSEVARLQNGLVCDVRRFAFHEAKLEGQFVFRIPEIAPCGTAFCTDAFVARVEHHGLRGFAPRLVWPEQPACIRIDGRMLTEKEYFRERQRLWREAQNARRRRPARQAR